MPSISQNLLADQIIQAGGVVSEKPTTTTSINSSSIARPFVHSSSPPPTSGKSRSNLVKMLGINYRWSSLTVDNLHPEVSSSNAKDTFKLTAYGVEGADTGDVYAGDRAPDASVTLLTGRGENRQEDVKTRFHHLFAPNKHTAFVLFPPESDMNSEVIERIEALQFMGQGELLDMFIVYQQSSPIPSLPSSFKKVSLLDDTGLQAWRGYELNNLNPMGFTTVIVRPDSVVGALVGNVEGLKKYATAVFSA